MIARMIDATLLKPVISREEALTLVREASSRGYWCVMLPPTILEAVEAEARDLGVRLCTVIGFPSGQHPLKSKITEIEHAASLGVEEVDIVPRLPGGEDLAKLVDKARESGIRLVKVIVEAPLLGDEDLARLVESAASAGADFVKTSTGVYSKGGDYYTVRRLYREAQNYGLKVKASGGIRDWIQAVLAVAAGASRIGTSSPSRVLDTYGMVV